MKVFAILILLLIPGWVSAQTGLDAVIVTVNPNGSQTYSLSIQVLAVMTALTFLPAAILAMTSFARIIIVLALLRQAIGTMSTPTNQILVGLALFLTFFIMSPVFEKSYADGIGPYLDEKKAVEEAFPAALAPFKKFMSDQVRDSELNLFSELAGIEVDENKMDEIPMTVLIPAFMTSEIKTAFQIGFLIFIPFLIIDLVVASVLMAMGMMMLSPLVISLPFKIMLFVLVDGWVLIMGTLASSFYVS